MREIFFFVCVWLLLPSIGFAQVYNCNGTWTTVPCENGVMLDGTNADGEAAPSNEGGAEATAQDITPAAPPQTRTGPCEDGRTLITTRPDPVLNWRQTRSDGPNHSAFKLSGTIRGYGDVSVKVTAFRAGTPLRGRDVTSKRLKLNPAGGERTFDLEFRLPLDTVWQAVASNVGNYKYCATEAEIIARGSQAPPQ